jgi:hypothetical protein
MSPDGDGAQCRLTATGRKAMKKTRPGVVSQKKVAGGAERWSVRTSDGRIETVTTRPSSADTMDRAVRRYVGAMKRLAKR